jgi:hypothetical protein
MNSSQFKTGQTSMRFSQRLIAVTIAVVLSGLVAGCSSMSSMNFDPTDLLDFLDTKKKLPGDRRAVFPEGVPGVEQGVPKDLYKGAAAQQEQQQVETAPPPVEPKSKTSAAQKSAKPQSKPRAAPEIASDPDADTDDGVAAAPPAPPAPRKRARTTSLPRDDQPTQQQSVQSQQQAPSSFPAPLPGGSFSR